MLKKDHTNLAWLAKPVDQWQEENEYRSVEEVVRKLCVVNDPAERAVKLAGDRIGTVRSEDAFQATLLTVKELQRLSADINRDSLSKQQLSNVIKKMLQIE